MPEITRIASSSFFHFRHAMQRQASNKPNKVCPSCGQPLDDAIEDCCEPTRAVADSERALELMRRQPRGGN